MRGAAPAASAVRWPVRRCILSAVLARPPPLLQDPESAVKCIVPNLDDIVNGVRPWDWHCRVAVRTLWQPAWSSEPVEH